jgi:hypothetical protein
MTISAEESSRARQAREFDRGARTSVTVSMGSGLLAALAWLFVLLRAVAHTPATRLDTFMLAVAVTASVVCAVFAAAWLVLQTLQRSEAS